MWSFSREKAVLPLASGNLHRGSQAAGLLVLLHRSSGVEGLVSCSPGPLHNSNMSFPSHPILMSQLLCLRVEPRVAKLNLELPNTLAMSHP